jgi:hypothetical protein
VPGACLNNSHHGLLFPLLLREMQLLARKRFFVSTLICVSITGVLLFTLVLRDSYDLFDRNRVELDPESSSSIPPSWSDSTRHCAERESSVDDAALDPLLDSLHPFASLNGLPTASYKGKYDDHLLLSLAHRFILDNLRNRTKYITSWGSSAGWGK